MGKLKYTLGNEEYDVDFNSIGEFTKNFPDAKPEKDTLEFKAKDGSEYKVAHNSISEFLKAVPDAEAFEPISTQTQPIKKERPNNGYTNDLIQSEDQYLNLLMKKNKTPDEDEAINDYLLHNKVASQRPDLFESATKAQKGSLKSGMYQLAAGINRAPGLIYDIAAYPQNKIADLTGLNIGTSSDKLPVLKQLNDLSRTAQEESKRITKKVAVYNPDYDEGVLGNIKKGNYTAALETAVDQGIQSLPITISTMAGGVGAGAAGLNVGATTFGLMGFTAAGNQMNKLQEENPDLPISTMTENAVQNGIIEALSENIFGSGATAQAISNIVAKEGKTKARRIVQDLITSKWVKMIQKNPALEVAGESASEVIAQIGQNAVSKYSGESPDLDLMDGVFDAGVVGGLMGTVSAGGIHGANKLANVNSKIKIEEQKVNEVKSQVDPIVNKESGLVESVQDKNGNGYYVVSKVDDNNIIVAPHNADPSRPIEEQYISMGSHDLDQLETIDPKDMVNTLVEEQLKTEQPTQEQTFSKNQTINVNNKSYVIDNIDPNGTITAYNYDGELPEPIEIPKTEYNIIQNDELRTDQGQTDRTGNAITGSNNSSQEGIQGPEGNPTGNNELVQNNGQDSGQNIVQNPGQNTETQLPGQQQPSTNNSRIVDIGDKKQVHITEHENGIDEVIFPDGKDLSKEVKANYDKSLVDFEPITKPGISRHAKPIVIGLKVIPKNNEQNNINNNTVPNPEVVADKIISEAGTEKESTLNNVEPNSLNNGKEMLDQTQGKGQIVQPSETKSAQEEQKPSGEALINPNDNKEPEQSILNNGLQKLIGVKNSSGSLKTKKVNPLTSREPESFEEEVLQFFVNGGRVDSQQLRREMGIRHKDFKTFIYAHKNGGKLLDTWTQSSPFAFQFEGDPRGGIDAIIDILSRYPTKSAMSARLAEYVNPKKEDIPVIEEELAQEAGEQSVLDEYKDLITDETEIDGEENNDEWLITATQQQALEQDWNETFGISNKNDVNLPDNEHDNSNITNESAGQSEDAGRNSQPDNAIPEGATDNQGETGIRSQDGNTDSIQQEAGSFGSDAGRTTGLEGNSGTNEQTESRQTKDEQNLIQSTDSNSIELIGGTYNFDGKDWYLNGTLETNPNTLEILNDGKADLDKAEEELRAKGRPEKSIQTMLSLIRDQIKNYQEEAISSLNEIKNTEIKSEAEKVNTEPTEAQKEAGNYQKGHVNIQGLDITIENPKDSKRSGTDEDGKAWETTMMNHYGYITGTKGADKDHVDVFIGDSPLSEKVFVVDQVNPKTRKFDEHKSLLGFNTEEEAKQAYLSNYEPGWQGLGSITEMPISEFKEWVKNPKETKKPLSDLNTQVDQEKEASYSDLTDIQKKEFDKRSKELDDKIKSKGLELKAAQNELQAKKNELAQRQAVQGDMFSQPTQGENKLFDVKEDFSSKVIKDAIKGLEAQVTRKESEVKDLITKKDNIINTFRSAIKAQKDMFDTGIENNYSVPESFNVNSFNEFSKNLAEGNINIDEYKKAFNKLLNSKDIIISELKSQTKPELLKNMSSFGLARYKNEAKDRIINALWDDKLMTFSFGSVSMDMGTKFEDAIARKVNNTTQQDIDNYVLEVAKQREEYIQRVQAFKKAMTNPETLSEFKEFIRVNGINKLSPEQKISYDNLVTDKVQETRKEETIKKSEISKVELGNTDLKLFESKHTKTNEPLFVVQMTNRVSPETYKELNSKAKQLGGYYSSFRGNGAIPGFTFKDKSQAEKFMELPNSNVSNIENIEQNEEVKKEGRAQKLREAANKIIDSANEELNKDRLTNTAKRAREAGAADARAEENKRIANTMINIANAIEKGEVKLLDGIKAKTHIDLLDSLVRSAKYNEVSEKVKEGNLSYSERLVLDSEPVTLETIEHLKYGFYPNIYGNNLKELVNKAEYINGVRRIAGRWDNKIKSLGEYDSYQIKNESEFQDISEMFNALPERDKKYNRIGDYISNTKRLKAMGIENDSMLRAALREYVKYRGGIAEENKVKKLERAIVGKNVGFDFFPTPSSVADLMVNEANISEGMDVLEPSAGNGNIADAIKNAGIEPDVIELSSDLSNILSAKGYDVVGTDFMNYNEKKYDRIIMNPPFSNGADGDHVMHAYDLLKPGGRIVAIVGEGTFSRSDKKATAFRNWLESVGGSEEKLPNGTFNDKKLLNTTQANARMVIIDKSESGIKFNSKRSNKFTDNTNSLPNEKVQSIIDDLNSRVQNPSKTVVVSNPNNVLSKMREIGMNETAIKDVKEHLKINNTTGFYDPQSQTTFIIGSFKDEKAVLSAYVHEVLEHHGLRLLFPNTNDFNKVVQSVYDSVGEEGFKNLLDEIDILNGNTVGETYDFYKDKSQTEKGEEYIAFLANKIQDDINLSPKEKSIWQRIKDAFMEFIAKFFKLSPNESKFTDKDLADLVKAAANEVVGYETKQDNISSVDSKTGNGTEVSPSGSDRNLQGNDKLLLGNNKPNGNNDIQREELAKELEDKLLTTNGDPRNILELSFITPNGNGVSNHFGSESHEEIASKVLPNSNNPKQDLLDYGFIRTTPKSAEIHTMPTSSQFKILYDAISKNVDNGHPYNVQLVNGDKSAYFTVEKFGDTGKSIIGIHDFYNKGIEPKIMYSGSTPKLPNEPIDILKNLEENSKKNKAKIKRRLWRERTQDNMINIKKLQSDFGLKVKDYSNIYLHDNQKNSRAQAAFEKFTEEKMKPVFEISGNLIKKYGKVQNINQLLELEKKFKEHQNITKAEYEAELKKFNETSIPRYLMAKHAPERNETLYKEGQIAKIMADRNTTPKEKETLIINIQGTPVPEDTNLSGMTNKEAEEVVNAFEKNVPKSEIDKLWESINKANEDIMQKWVDYGRYSQKTLAEIKARNWKYYVPLRGWEKTNEDLEQDYYYENGKGEFGGTQRAKGRTSLSDDPLANMANNAQSVIMWGEKNRVRQAAINLIYDNKERTDLFYAKKIYNVTEPNGTTYEAIKEGDRILRLNGVKDDGTFDTEDLGTEKDLEDNGMTLSTVYNAEHQKRRPSNLGKQHEITSYKNGEKYIGVFKNVNYGNEINKVETTKPIPGFAIVTRFLSGLRTALSPYFMIRNTLRDFQGAIWNTFIEDSPLAAAKFASNYGIAMRYVKRGMQGKGNLKYDQYYKDFVAGGGRTGSMSFASIDQIKNDIDKLQKKLSRTKWEKVAYNSLGALYGKQFWDLCSTMSAWSENVTRFAAYVTAREAGKSELESINMAKEISVNFDRKGTWASSIGSFIGFYNASMQGALKQMNLAKNHPVKYGSSVIAMAAMGYALSMLYHAMNDDEDKNKNFKELNKYNRFNNLFIGTDGHQVMIPLAQGYRMFNALGCIIYDLQHGKTTKEDATWDLVETMQNGLSPMQISNIYDREKGIGAQTLLDASQLITAVQPFIQLAQNKDYMGHPIAKEMYTKKQEEYTPESEKYLHNTNPMLIAFTHNLFLLGGGTEGTKVKKDGTKVSPFADVSPSRLEFMLNTFGGSLTGIALDASNQIYNRLESTTEKLEAKKHKEEDIIGFDYLNTPIVKAFYRNKTTGEISEQYKDLKEEYERLNDLYQKDDAFAEFNDMADSPQYKKYSDLKYAEKQLKELYKDVKKAESDSEVNEYKLEIDKIKHEMLLKYKPGYANRY